MTTRPSIIALAACALLAARAAAQVRLRWTADTAAPAPVAFDYWRGETVSLEPAFTSYGSAVDLDGADVAFMWQTNGMGSNWWVMAGDVLTGSLDRARAVFSHTNDPGGASALAFFLRVTPASGGAMYRARGVLNVKGSPGADPAAMPGPEAWPGLATDLAPLVAAGLAGAFEPAGSAAAVQSNLAAEASARALAVAAVSDALAAVDTNRATRLWSADASQYIDGTGGVWRVYAVETGSPYWTLVVPEHSVYQEVEALAYPLPSLYESFIFDEHTQILAGTAASGTVDVTLVSTVWGKTWLASNIPDTDTLIELRPATGVPYSGAAWSAWLVHGDRSVAFTNSWDRALFFRDAGPLTNGLLSAAAADARYPQIANLPTNAATGWLVYDTGSNVWWRVACSNLSFTVELAQ